MNRVIAFATLSMLAAVATAAPKAPVYKDITMRDFQIDGPQLAAQSAPVQITGGYTKPGNMDMLYAKSSDAMVATYSNSAYAEQLPFIPLLTDNASHAIREAMYDCHSRNAVGCLLTVRGVVTMCSVTNGFGAVHEAPCLEVVDGSAYMAPPPPQPIESVQHQLPKNAAPPLPPRQQAAAPQTTTIAPAPAQAVPVDNRSMDQKVRDCIQSPAMADASDVYRKCLKLVQPAP